MTAARESGSAKTSIQVIERMIRLLDALARHSNAASLKQLSADTGLHPSTAHRILGVMVASRIVDRLEPGQYRLGMKLLELGNLVKSRINVRQIALPFMHRVHQELLETVNLSVRQGDEIVYVERTASSQSMMRVVQVIGGRAPLHITAVGKIFLLEDGPDQLRDYAMRTGLPRYTANTLVDITDLARELEAIRRDGYAFDNEEAEKGVSCTGAGIRDDEGNLVAGLSVSAPSDRFERGWAPKVLAIAEEISRAIGFGTGGSTRDRRPLPMGP
jgi:DNA-binding IclR family transcriptional regulator